MSKKRPLQRKTAALKAPAASQIFSPCDPDMTICGDCEGNRTRRTCPRLKEWLMKRKSTA